MTTWNRRIFAIILGNSNQVVELGSCLVGVVHRAGVTFQGKDERIVDGTRYTRYLDLDKWYGIVVPKDENAYNEMCDYKVWDDNEGDIRDIYWFMKFHEDKFYLMEKYLFKFIDAECNLLINMYEEEWIEGDNLKKTLEITNRMINNSDEDHCLRQPLHRGIQARHHNRYRGIKRLLITELNQ